MVRLTSIDLLLKIDVDPLLCEFPLLVSMFNHSVLVVNVDLIWLCSCMNKLTIDKFDRNCKFIQPAVMIW